MPADSPYNPDGSIDWSYFNKPAVSGQVYKYSPETGGYSTTLSLAEAQAQGYGSLSDTEKRNIYNTAAILNPDVGAAPFVLGQPAVGQAYRSMNTGDPVPVTKPVAAAAASGITAAATLKNGGNGKMANTGDNGEGLDLLGMDLSGILTALGIGGTTAATVTTIAGILGALRLKWPWQTVEGEGFIAPWSQQTETPQGWIQTAAYNQPGIPFALGAGGGAGGGAGTMGTVARSWTNAAKDGSTPATANFIQLMDGKIYAQSIKTGVIRRVPKPRMVHLHSNMSLGTYVKAERMLDRMAGRIAKRTKSLKRSK